MERNEELFRQVADAIEQHPEKYDQGDWCGTTACIAGWALLKGRFGSFAALNDWEENREPSETISTPAAALLGLDDDEAHDLFCASWRPHDGLSVPDALRKIGEGAAIEDVSA